MDSFKDMSGKKSALQPVEDEKGRRTWDRKEFSSLAETRLKK